VFRKKALSNLVFVLALLLGSSGVARALTVYEPPFELLVEHSDLIFIGTVVEIEECNNPDYETNATLVTYKVLQVLKGETTGPGNKFSIRYNSAIQNDRTATLALGYPKVVIGDLNILFLNLNVADRHT